MTIAGVIARYLLGLMFTIFFTIFGLRVLTF